MTLVGFCLILFFRRLQLRPLSAYLGIEEFFKGSKHMCSFYRLRQFFACPEYVGYESNKKNWRRPYVLCQKFMFFRIYSEVTTWTWSEEYVFYICERWDGQVKSTACHYHYLRITENHQLCLNMHKIRSLQFLSFRELKSYKLH